MNPSSNEAFSAPLSPAGEQAPSVPETAQAPVSPGLAAPPMLPLPPLAAPSPGAPLPSAGTSPVAAAKDDAAMPPTTAVPLTDDDLIEKDWVNKAKAIVERTRDDPYRQSEELTAVKVDYMQKHYNKTIKLAK